MAENEEVVIQALMDENNETYYSCSICDLKLKTYDYILLHMKTHGKPDMYQCEICYRHFDDAQQLDKHMAKHPPRSAFICLSCNIKFMTAKDLARHQRYSCASRNQSEKGEGSKIKKADQISESTETRIGEYYQCPLCNGTYKPFYNYQKHRKFCEQIHSTVASRSEEQEVYMSVMVEDNAGSKANNTQGRSYPHTTSTAYQCPYCNQKFMNIQHSNYVKHKQFCASIHKHDMESTRKRKHESATETSSGADGENTDSPKSSKKKVHTKETDDE